MATVTASTIGLRFIAAARAAKAAVSPWVAAVVTSADAVAAMLASVKADVPAVARATVPVCAASATVWAVAAMVDANVSTLSVAKAVVRATTLAVTASACWPTNWMAAPTPRTAAATPSTRLVGKIVFMADPKPPADSAVLNSFTLAMRFGRKVVVMASNPGLTTMPMVSLKLSFRVLIRPAKERLCLSIIFGNRASMPSTRA